jgi:hypothetical protein
MQNINSVVIHSARQSNRQNISIEMVESQFNGSDICGTDYKRKTSHIADTDVLLPDKLNTFFAYFKDRITQFHQHSQ